MVPDTLQLDNTMEILEKERLKLSDMFKHINSSISITKIKNHCTYDDFLLDQCARNHITDIERVLEQNEPRGRYQVCSIITKGTVPEWGNSIKVNRQTFVIRRHAVENYIPIATWRYIVAIFYSCIPMYIIYIAIRFYKL